MKVIILIKNRYMSVLFYINATVNGNMKVLILIKNRYMSVLFDINATVNASMDVIISYNINQKCYVSLFSFILYKCYG